MQTAYFDNYAETYDAHFTESAVGKAQRRLVHEYLKKRADKDRSVLELNSGTGEDALQLGNLFQHWTCTDISSSMLEVCRRKNSGRQNCSAVLSSIQQIEQHLDKKFDLVFSNFGGLNCLNEDEMRFFARSCARLGQPHSELIFVVMGRKCAWERFYFGWKNESGKKDRRLRENGVEAEIYGEKFKTWYYSPEELRKIFSNEFQLVTKKPVGFFIPPSYLNSFFQSKPFAFSILKGMDGICKNFSFLSDRADHYLIHFKRK